MGTIKKIEQTTQNPYLNLYTLKVANQKGHEGKYYVASRARTAEDLEISTRQTCAHGVIIYSLYGQEHDRVVLVRQYRYPIDTYIYEFPAGLVEEGEDFHDAAVRELKEETGLTLRPIPVDTAYEKPYYTTIGMTDECCGTVYGYAYGDVSTKMQELSEEIEIVLADRVEVRRILKNERVSITCAYMLMHFLEDEQPFAFLKEKPGK